MIRSIVVVLLSLIARSAVGQSPQGDSVRVIGPDSAGVYRLVEEMPRAEAFDGCILGRSEAEISCYDGNWTVWLEFIVDENGSVLSPKIVRGAECPGLDSAALNEVKDASWIPGRHNDKPVKVRMIVPVKFRIR